MWAHLTDVKTEARVRLSLHGIADVSTNGVSVGACSGQYQEGNPCLAGFDFVFNF